MPVRRKYIRAITEQILNVNQISQAPVDVRKIAYQIGVDIKSEQAEQSLSGFLLRDVNNHKALIGVNEYHPETRKRFTIAHELGHLLLHEGEKIHIDHTYQLNLRNEVSSQGINIEEKEANLFAAELLMPVNFIKQDISKITTIDFSDDTELSKLANTYQVSTQAFIFRLAYLNYIQL